METKMEGSQAPTTEKGYGTGEEQGRTFAGAGVREYGAKDCFEDCIKAFHYEKKEKPECARACGLEEY